MRLREKLALMLTTVVATVAALALPAGAQDGDVEAVDILGANPVRCAELTTDAYPVIGGGCIAFAGPNRATMAVRTLFGPMRFARCDIAFTLHIGPDGAIWIQAMSIEGSGACGDILQCREKVPADKIAAAAKLPWKGRIARTSDDRLRSRVELCFDTCLGRFEGRTAFDLVKERGDWKLRATDAVAGQSGFELDGEWELDATGGNPRSSAYVKREGAAAPGFDLR